MAWNEMQFDPATGPRSVIGVATASDGTPTDELVPRAGELLEVPTDLVRTTLDLELTEGAVIADRVGDIGCIFLAGLHRAERATARNCSSWASSVWPQVLTRA